MVQGDFFVKDEIEKICESICKEVPVQDGGGKWYALYNPVWPDEFSKREQKHIRIIAMKALMVARPDMADAILSFWGGPRDMDE